MIRRVADRIAPLVDEIVINCRSDQHDAIECALSGLQHPVSFAHDPEPDRGPLAGIMAGSETLPPSTYAAIVACDMPFLDSHMLATLFEIAEGHDGAVPELDGWVQPTHAVFKAGRLHEACAASLDAGDDRPVHAIDRLDVKVVDAEELAADGSLRSFENINTREAFEAAERRLQ